MKYLAYFIVPLILAVVGNFMVFVPSLHQTFFIVMMIATATAALAYLATRYRTKIHWGFFELLSLDIVFAVGLLACLQGIL